MKCAFVGLGWLGIPLANFLTSKGFEISGTTRSSEKQQQLSAKGWGVICWDASTDESIPSSFFEACELVIINIPPGKLRENNRYAEVCCSIATAIPSASKVIFVSTTGIYPDEALTTNEDEFSRTPYLKENLFALTEERLDAILKERLTIVRFAGLIGPNRNPARFLAGKTDVSNPNAPVNLIHLNDCIQIIDAIITQNKWGEIYNGCASDHPTRQEYYTAMCECFGLVPPTFNVISTISKLVVNTKSILQLRVAYNHSIWMENKEI
jgi:nucleoside-diphosphate-sugar epimerase